jgi:DNA-binding transcriptional MerR regulator
MQAQRGELLGTSEAARRLAVPISTLTYWDRTGVLPPATRIVGSGRRIYTEADLDVARARIEARRRDRAAAPS